VFPRRDRHRSEIVICSKNLHWLSIYVGLPAREIGIAQNQKNILCCLHRKLEAIIAFRDKFREPAVGLPYIFLIL
jgi:hypothetical protein